MTIAEMEGRVTDRNRCRLGQVIDERRLRTAVIVDLQSWDIRADPQQNELQSVALAIVQV